MNLRRTILAFLVSFCASQLPGCGLTQWQRDMDTLGNAIDHLNSAEMSARIAAARPGTPVAGSAEIARGEIK